MAKDKYTRTIPVMIQHKEKKPVPGNMTISPGMPQSAPAGYTVGQKVYIDKTPVRGEIIGGTIDKKGRFLAFIIRIKGWPRVITRRPQDVSLKPDFLSMTNEKGEVIKEYYPGRWYLNPKKNPITCPEGHLVRYLTPEQKRELGRIDPSKNAEAMRYCLTCDKYYYIGDCLYGADNPHTPLPPNWREIPTKSKESGNAIIQKWKYTGPLNKYRYQGSDYRPSIDIYRHVGKGHPYHEGYWLWTQFFSGYLRQEYFGNDLEAARKKAINYMKEIQPGKKNPTEEEPEPRFIIRGHRLSMLSPDITPEQMDEYFIRFPYAYFAIPPTRKEIQKWMNGKEVPKATDGCRIKADGYCIHGRPSWLFFLRLIEPPVRRRRKQRR